MIGDGGIDMVAYENGIERLGRAARLGQIQMRNERIAAERISREEEIHVLEVAVEARRHDDAVQDAEAVAQRLEWFDERRGERGDAVTAGPGEGLLADIVLD